MRTMNSASLLCVCVVCMVSSLCFGFAGGDGSAGDPWQIETIADLEAVNGDLGACYILNCNIDLSGETYTDAVIAPYDDSSSPKFTGSFDGNGFSIIGLTINSTEDHIGLFGQTDGSEIMNLGIENCYITGDYFVGGMVGYNDGSITNCYSTGTVSGGSNVGGLVGLDRYGNITDCYSTGDVSGCAHVGGMVGKNNQSSITNCYSTGTVSGTRNFVGGMVGNNDYGSSITNCYSTGTVSGAGSCVGGLMGVSDGIITNCYSTGNVSGYGYVGGLAGDNYGIITNCYSKGDVSGADHGVGGLAGNNYGSITNCYSTGTVSGANHSVGGLVGHHYSCSITNCYSTGTVSGTGDYVGGLVGLDRYGSITNCYSTGTVSGTGNYVGGFCGYQLGDDAEMRNCFWDVDTSGQTVGYNLDSSEPGTVTNVVGKTTAEMMTQSTFTDAGWDFSSADGDEADWFMAWDGYPIFPWQISPADIYPDGNNNLKDFALFARYWMCESCGVYNYYCEFADLDFDGDVDANDLIYIADYWLEGK